MNAPIDWLLEGEAWIVYRTRRDLLTQSENNDLVKSARNSMLANVQVQDIVTGLQVWPGAVISSHKSAGQPFHKLTFVADMFYMGTDFRKLKVPFVWYDILHVLDVLSRFSWLKKDTRLLNMLEILKSKADQQGCFTPESTWTAWKDWEFGQKKMPSRWLTLLAWRIIGRMEAI